MSYREEARKVKEERGDGARSRLGLPPFFHVRHREWLWNHFLLIIVEQITIGMWTHSLRGLHGVCGEDNSGDYLGSYLV
jgi:hypothetical protein